MRCVKHGSRVHIYAGWARHLTLCGISTTQGGDFFAKPVAPKLTCEQVDCLQCARLYDEIKNIPDNEIADDVREAAILAANNVHGDCVSCTGVSRDLNCPWNSVGVCLNPERAELVHAEAGIS